MDIHRCRFVPYPSSAINVVAFSHSSDKLTKARSTRALRLAVGRTNGDIEIWNPLKGAWFQESILRGGKDRSIEGIVWTQDPTDVDRKGYKIPGRLRLFSIGYSQAVTEWDLAAGKPLRHSAGSYGEIWCMAAQPKDIPPRIPESKNGQEREAIEQEGELQNIAVGCADGSTVILSTADADLRFTKILARPAKKRTRVLSLTFQDRHTIIAGHADSMIRIYDIRGGQQIRNMSLGGGPKGGPKETLVWTVKCLSDGTIVSGDSTGTVSFWDGKHYALLQRIQGHDADILDVAVSTDGRSVFSGGMDRRTALYGKTYGGSSAKIARWAKVAHSRLHQNDVKTMAIFDAKGMSVLISGGLDTNLIVTPVQKFGKEHHRTLSSLPQQPAMSSARRQRLLLSWWDRELSIWSILRSQGQSEEECNGNFPQCVNGRKLVAKVALREDESITSAALASDGTLLVVSTIAEIRLFRLRSKDGKLKVLKMQLPANVATTGAKIIQLSPDRRWLLTITPEDRVQLYRLLYRERSRLGIQVLPKSIRLERLPRESIKTQYFHGSLGNYDRSITRVSFSSDSRILVVGDLSGYLDSWVLKGHEDLHEEEDGRDGSNRPSSSDESDSDEEYHPQVMLGQHWIRNPAASLVPKLRNAPLVLSFRPLVASSSQEVRNGGIGLHPTRHNPHPHSNDLPDGEDRLLIVTADNQLLELNVLAGKLSDWSRRNPLSVFPPAFRDLRDRAKGVMWDVRGGKERIWIYGVNWLWMFDLSQDLPSLPEQPDRERREHTAEQAKADGMPGRRQPKRKRQADEEEEEEEDVRRARDSGAGSKIPDSELAMGIGGKILKVNGVDAHDGKLISLQQGAETESEEEEEEERSYISREQTALLSLRRERSAEGEELQQTDGAGSDAIVGQTSHEDGVRVRETKGKRGAAYWHTYKYRPILGIVPLGGADDEEDDDDENDAEADEDEGGDKGASRGTRLGIEVALVERPLWEMDLPPRYYGHQEWNP